MTLVNQVLTWQIELRIERMKEEVEEKRTTSQHKVSHSKKKDFYLGQKFSDDHASILSRIARLSVLDSSGEFRVASNVVQGKLMEKEGEQEEEEEVKDRSTVKLEEVTLVTQCSLSKLHYIPQLTKVWQGPVSVAVFVLSNEVPASVQAFLQLQKCFSAVRENVTFSLVFPLNSPTSPHVVPTAGTVPCHLILGSEDQNSYNFHGIQYPNNLLRNTAIKVVRSQFMLVLDVDMQPNENLHHAFLNYAKHNDLYKKATTEHKMVWVVPSYEVKEEMDVPRNKESLLELLESGDARPFYQEMCWKCQKYTDYTAWEKATVVDSSKVRPLYEVLWRDPWEPFYIAPTDIPHYDERFRQYGFNRISQVCELHVSGYGFQVLDSAFVVHTGFKTANTFHSTKDSEQERNRILFRQFKADLKDKYPESSRRCY
ncbi:beta-1,4-glucuronyltransferase 1-like isoform X2 [Oratosquilla oratoria]|uniref:beta-1,4-glucuronyltransferase 1-like isoform X2 n=1 Tax=Oratosquilla oratoria TaxID=337810 RepID=UPI003F75D4DF